MEKNVVIIDLMEYNLLRDRKRELEEEKHDAITDVMLLTTRNEQLANILLEVSIKNLNDYGFWINNEIGYAYKNYDKLKEYFSEKELIDFAFKYAESKNKADTSELKEE